MPRGRGLVGGSQHGGGEGKRKIGIRTEGHLGEKVVDDVEVRYVVEEEAALPPEDTAVDGRGGAALEVPLFTTVVRHVGVGVMEVGDHDDCGPQLDLIGAPPKWWKGLTPVRNLKPGDAVVLDDLHGAVDGAGVGDGPDHECDADVGHDDRVALRLGEQDGVG